MPNITPNTFWPNTTWPSGGVVTSGGGGGGGGGYTPPSQPVKFKLWSTAPNTSPDYTRYVYTQPVKVDRINEPDYLDVSLVPFDSAFTKLVRGNYVEFTTGTYGTWFSGFVANDPELELLGVAKGQSVYGYKYQFNSEDYLLNVKPIPILPPFLNTTQGEILRQLVAILAPEFAFDITGIQDGLSIARYIADPTKRFTDVVKEFSEAAYYRWSCRSSKVYFEPQDTTPANIVADGTNQHFTPASLSIQPSTDPIVNDAIVLGDIEPQNYMIEFFVGDGWTKKFALISSVFGVDSSVLLDDDFSNSQTDDTKWDVFDDPQNYLQVYNGYMNCLGGPNDGSYSVYLQSANLIPLEGILKATHGEWDVVSGSDGVICSFWVGAPKADLSNCVYGIRVSKGVNGSTLLQPIVNGVVDTSQSYHVWGPQWRYVIRTSFTFTRQHRYTQSYASMDSSGSVSQNGGTVSADVFTASTWISAIDPNTSTIQDGISWNNFAVPIKSDWHYAYYVPAVLNDLHVTFTGITVSTPLQASLYIKDATTGQWSGQLLGPNEMDAFDGQAPVATIVDSNQGWTTRSSKLGNGQYNPGNAALEYFTDPTKQADQQYSPPQGSLLRLFYRRAGVAMARVQDPTSIQTEAAAWGDSGVRSITRQDLQPSPRNSAECEFAAEALVNDFSRQHWDGSYKQYSLYEFTGEPLSGTVMKFQNLPTQYPPTLTAETIQEVKSTFLCGTPQEIFLHEITFGKKSSIKKAMASFTKKVDVFQPQDTAEIPDPIDVGVVGTAFTDDITDPQLTNWDRNNIYFDISQTAPLAGGFEMRYTDESWGADDAKNLVTRNVFDGQTSAKTTFFIPRSIRGRVVFIKAFDGRNKALYSEDLTTSKWVTNTGTTVANSTKTNPDDQLARISTVTFGISPQILQNLLAARLAGKVSFSASLRAHDSTQVGKIVSLEVLSSTGAVLARLDATLTAGWQRHTVSFTDSVNDGSSYWCQLESSNGVVVDATRCSFEVGTLTETLYAKTNNILYGALSRYATGIHPALPMIPPGPSATLDTSNITKPVLNITLPSIQTDVWGIEVRASDDKTVLYKESLKSPNITLQPALPNADRNVTYYVYTFNILGEYSDPFTAQTTIPTPVISNLYVDNSGRTVHWDGIGATSFLVEVDATDASMSHVYWQNMQSANSLWLNDPEFFPQRWISVTPFDDIGAGTPSVVSHAYTPVAVATWDTSVVSSVPPPPTPATDVTPPPTAADWTRDYVSDSWDNYTRNNQRYY